MKQIMRTSSRRFSASLLLAALHALSGALMAAPSDTLRLLTPEEKSQGQFLWYGPSPEGYPRRIPRPRGLSTPHSRHHHHAHGRAGGSGR